jgi:hypothetical protein
VRGGLRRHDDRLPFRSCLEEYRGACRPSLALPKYVGFFEAFLKYEPAAATDMLQIETLLQSAVILPCPADPNGLRGQPGGDLSSGVVICALHQCFCNTHRFRSLRVLTVSRGCLLKDPMARQFCTMQCGRQVRKYSPGSQLLSREYIGESCRFVSAPTFICVYVAQSVECSEVAMETVRFFSSIILLELQRF